MDRGSLAAGGNDHAKLCELSCAPGKSELLMIQPGKPKKKPPPNVTITIDGIAIKPAQQIRILGLLLQIDGKAQAAVTKMKTSAEQILGIIRRVSNRNRGLKEDDVMRLVRAFVVSRVTYCAPYLQLTRDTLNTVLREATKQALGVPKYSSTLILLDMGAHKTVEELIEAHLSNQRIRLSQTEHGRAVLRKIGWQIEPVPIKAPSGGLEDNNSNETPSPEHDAGQGRREAHRAGQSHGPEAGREPQGHVRGRLTPKTQ
ncbi:hypothetical protein HPB51_027035 [Rhipicephalus microplus]|uniref:Uncharacterized protein n=1 Tax=Rhipicephalus microplus TaxID=6941 RepID=A0A9J6D1M8_RHIMP|nr:hypothetical protein HPB51_027035 [Rhipicephalus microplus]